MAAVDYSIFTGDAPTGAVDPIPDIVYSSPDPADAVDSSWLPSWGSVVDTIGTAAKGAAAIIGGVNAAQTARDQRSIDVAQRQADNALAMQKIAAESQVAQLGFQAQIAKAQQALRSVTGGSGISVTAIALGGIAVYWLAKHK